METKTYPGVEENIFGFVSDLFTLLFPCSLSMEDYQQDLTLGKGSTDISANIAELASPRRETSQKKGQNITFLFSTICPSFNN